MARTVIARTEDSVLNTEESVAGEPDGGLATKLVRLDTPWGDPYKDGSKYPGNP